MGITNCPAGIQNRVYIAPSKKGPSQGDPCTVRSGPKIDSRNGDFGSVAEASNSRGSSRARRKFVSFDILPGSQEGQPMAPDPEPETSQQTVYSPETFQDGNLSIHHSSAHSRFLGHINRPEGCVSTCADTSSIPAFPGIQIQGGGLPVQRYAVRPLDSSEGIHPYHQVNPCLPSVQGDDSFRLSRRLASHCQLQGGVPPSYTESSGVTHRPRLGHQPEQVLLNSSSESDVLGGRSGPFPRTGLSLRPQNSVHCKSRQGSFTSQAGEGSCLAPLPRPACQSSRRPAFMQTQDETSTVPCSETLQTFSGFSNEVCSSQPRSETVTPLVVTSLESARRQTFQGPQAPLHDVHGCLPDGLGSSAGSSFSSGPLEPQRGRTTHQRPGALSGGQSCVSLEVPPQGSSPDSLHRQFNGGGLHQPSGRNSVSTALSRDPQPVLGLPGDQPSHQSLSPGGSHEHNGRRPLQRETESQRMGVIPGMGQPHLLPLRKTVVRPVCLSNQLQDISVLHPFPPSSGVGDGRYVSGLEQPLFVRFPTVVHAPESSVKTQRVVGRDVAGSPVLAQATLVSGHSRTVSRPTIQVSAPVQTPNPTQRPDPSSRNQRDPSMCLAGFKRRLQEAGLSGNALEIATGSRRPATVRTYDSRLDKFRSWALDNNVDPMEATVDEVCSFFVSLFSEGRQVSTIRNYRSALGAIHKGFSDGSSMSNNPAIGHLLKGMFIQRPPQRRLAPSWSINDVLVKLAGAPFEPIQDAPLEALTHKTLFLVAAASARRRSELHALSVTKGFIRFSPGGVSLLPHPQFLAKNQSESFSPAPIFLPSIESASSVREDRLVCPVRALKWYIHKTKALRSSDALFILPRAPFSAASKDTISKWIVRTIQPHASSSETVRAHDLRGQASSVAWFEGIPLPDIMLAASWKTPSTFVSCYLKDVISQKGSFASSVLLGHRRQPSGRPSSTSRC